MASTIVGIKKTSMTSKQLSIMDYILDVVLFIIAPVTFCIFLLECITEIPYTKLGAMAYPEALQ